MTQDGQVGHALQMILDACSLQRYIAPYDVVVNDARGTRIAARLNHDGAELLDGDLGSIGLLSAPLGIFVTDARGESAEFSVALFEDEDGRRMAPIVTYPKSWIKPTPGSEHN